MENVEEKTTVVVKSAKNRTRWQRNYISKVLEYLRAKMKERVETLMLEAILENENYYNYEN
jgi:transcriptional regulator NrdR family protein